ncbi:MAG: hypothetical protein MAG451_02922 [Anaerolineales bacterium]|nr:hypothetical protein [Anaerolineales bacterium]
MKRKTIEERTKRRQQKYRRYFENAGPLSIDYSRRPVYNLEQAGPQRLLAFQDDEGFAIALGVIEQMNTREMTVVTPADDVNRVASLHVGSLHLNLDTGTEMRG